MPKAEKTVVVREGDKDRHERGGYFGAPDARGTTASGTKPAEASSSWVPAIAVVRGRWSGPRGRRRLRGRGSGTRSRRPTRLAARLAISATETPAAATAPSRPTRLSLGQDSEVAAAGARRGRACCFRAPSPDDATVRPTRSFRCSRVGYAGIGGSFSDRLMGPLSLSRWCAAFGRACVAAAPVTRNAGIRRRRRRSRRLLGRRLQRPVRERADGQQQLRRLRARVSHRLFCGRVSGHARLGTGRTAGDRRGHGQRLLDQQHRRDALRERGLRWCARNIRIGIIPGDRPGPDERVLDRPQFGDEVREGAVPAAHRTALATGAGAYLARSGYRGRLRLLDELHQRHRDEGAQSVDAVALRLQSPRGSTNPRTWPRTRRSFSCRTPEPAR